ncbi:MAG: hypothetical protein C0625_02205 [Arcobacter sp.]|nr:MAG: hypothetical protein C0625_02205 [Arcobacter sp.]
MNKGKDLSVIKRYKSSENIDLGFMGVEKSIDKEENIYIESIKNNDDKFLKIKKLYDYSNVLYSQYHDKAVCQKGCAHCCKIQVDVSEIEVEYIEKNTDYKRSMTNNINTNDYCALLDLDTGLCSIYDYRPLSCRAFLTFDNPSYCEEKNSSHTVTTLIKNPKLYQMYQLLLLTTNTNQELRDIRNYFQ